MAGYFSYSFDRDTYHGRFNTRAEALAAGLKHLADERVQGETVFVGKRMPIDLGLNDLADTAIRMMQERLRSEGEASEPLMRIDEQQLARLDERLRRAIGDWLADGNLTPAGSKVTAISEHATETSAIDALR